MKKRLLVATIFMLTLPLWFSPSAGKTTLNPTPFAIVAEAGHQVPGGLYCNCDNPSNCPLNNPVVYRSDQSADVETDATADPDTALLDAFMMLFRMLIF